MNNGIFCWQFPLNNYGFYEFHYHPSSRPRPSSYYMYVKKKKIYAIFTYILPSLVPQLIPKREPTRVTDFLNSP